MDITLHRDEELGSEPRRLPAEIYNTAHILLAQSGSGCVFIPIRSMQYLAIVDAEEIVFVQGEFRNQVDIAWTDFHPRERSGLNDPVPYTARYYRRDSADTMPQLQAEFMLALQRLYGKLAGPREAAILPFTAPPAGE